MTGVENKINNARLNSIAYARYKGILLTPEQDEDLDNASQSTLRHRARAYSLNCSHSAVSTPANDKGRQIRRRSLPSNDVQIVSEAECLNVPQNNDSERSVKMDTDDNVSRVRRAKSFRERPNKSGDNLRRVRSFKTTSKGLVNRGDSFKLRKSTACTGAAMFTGNDDTEFSPTDRQRLIPPPFVSTSNEERSTNYFRVMLLGAEGVGKSSLIDQFMTSDFLGSGDFQISQSEDERTVTVQVDGDESTLEFVQSEYFQDRSKSYPIDGFVVVYDATKRDTFDFAVDLLKQLIEEFGPNRAMILVGNKTDLVRKRKITTDNGRSAADDYKCKYIETSAALNHQVDELLVGVHKQILLKSEGTTAVVQHPNLHNINERKISFKKTKRFLEKLFLGHSGKEKKTENLYVE